MITSRRLGLLLNFSLLAPNGLAAQTMTWQEHREAAQAQLRYQLADPVSAVQHLEKALALARAQGAPAKDIGDLMDRLAAAYHLEDRKSDKWERTLLDTLAYKRKALGTNSSELVPTLEQLSTLRHYQGRTFEMLQLSAEALNIQTRNFGARSSEAAHATMILGGSFLAAGQPTEAEPLLRRAVEIVRQLPHPPDEVVAETVSTLAGFLSDTGRKDEAAAIKKELNLSAVLERVGQRDAEEARAYNTAAARCRPCGPAAFVG
jgi:tetratricopeptide (TPR) repeat protein